MSRAPDWKADEFDTLLQAFQLGNDAVASRLAGRTAGAVGVVRAAVHRYHTTGAVDMLSEIMRRRVQASAGRLVCAQCTTRY